MARRRNLAGAAAALAAQGSRVQYYGGDHELDACSSSNNRAFPLPDYQSMVFRGVVATGACMSLEPKEFHSGPKPSRNVFGDKLEPCSTEPLTGFFRNGCCDTGAEDVGSHTVCVAVTDEFLAFSKFRGNDLSTPRPQFGFAGLKAGDRWCLCAPRWQEALQADSAPRVLLRATHEAALNYCSLADLKRYALDLS